MLLNKKLIISQTKFVYVVDKDHVTYCQADDGYTTINLICGKSYLLVKSLSRVATEDFNSDDFIRVNQSYLINRNYIDRIDKHNKQIHILNNQLIPFTLNLKELILLIGHVKDI